MHSQTNQPSPSPLARRLDGVSESATLKLNATVQQMKAQGIDVMNLTAGEPDFWVQNEAKGAAIEAIQANRSKYTPAPGIPELRAAVAQKTNLQQPTLAAQRPWQSSNVVVSTGAKQALFNSLMALVNPGDEVIIVSPYWLSYPEMVKIAGGIPKIIHASFDQGFKILPGQLREALGPRVKVILLNSPSNPSGILYTRDEFRALAEVIAQTPGAENAWIISDEIYDRITLGDIPFCSFLEAAPELFHRTITINGMSKSAAMTGWRIGWSIASESVTQGIITLQGQSTSGANSVAQWASLAALKIPETQYADQIQKYRNRRNLLLKILRNEPKLEVFPPLGAFYIFVGVKNYLGAGEDSMGFAQRLLESARVAVVPGTPFGEPEFIRLSFATDERTIEEGGRRLIQYLNSAKKL